MPSLKREKSGEPAQRRSSIKSSTSTGALSVERAIRQARIVIESVSPAIAEDGFAVKAIVGQSVTVSAIIFTDGHEKLAARVCWRKVDARRWNSALMTHTGNDLWQVDICVSEISLVEFIVEAWVDHFLTYSDELEKKYAAGLDISVELQEGMLLLESIAAEASVKQARTVQRIIRQLDLAVATEEKMALLLSPDSSATIAEAEHRPFLSCSPVFRLDVERPQAGFASWYEMFPRSATKEPSRHGTFADVIERLPDIAAMGFDVLYFPPIHPIGHSHRKGPNNSLVAGDEDPGSPYAIGSEEGGHEAIHSQLGTPEDFSRLVAEAKKLNLEIALDFAIQCSPDHPWLAQHPGWFNWRPNGSIRYAENPPKKYEDIVNVDFYSADALPGLWLALRDVVMGWVERGVKMFRVDNPHTKPLPFWQWLIADVRRRDPEVIFLAEAFTRPAMMARLGKLGFSQSYTYFTWRNTAWELGQYFTELNQSPWRECYRPNFFVNTPDINPEFLHDSGRPGFLIRAALATMGSGLWGMYSGFELCESDPIPGKEEYLHSEKYEIRPRNYRAPGNIVAEITQLNRIRRQNPALQTHLGLQVYHVANPNIILFGKRTEDLSNFILVAVSLDPRQAQETDFELPLWEFDLPDDAVTEGEDLMNGHRWQWVGKRQWMRMEPWNLPFGIWRLGTNNNLVK